MMSKKFEYDVFLSYNSEDTTRVRRLAERLRAAGVRVWFDKWVIKAGHDIYLAIERGLETSRTLILCMSPAVFAAEWVDLERNTVLFRDPSNTNRHFIPLLFTQCKPPDSVRRYKYVDFRQEGDLAFEELLEVCLPPPKSPGLAKTEPKSSNESDLTLRKLCWPTLYHWKGCWADAVRLAGRQNEFFPPEDIEIKVDNSQYVLPELLVRDQGQLIPWVEERAQRLGLPHHNAPCVRLVDYRAAA
jgi:hypothetical protein